MEGKGQWAAGSDGCSSREGALKQDEHSTAFGEEGARAGRLAGSLHLKLSRSRHGFTLLPLGTPPLANCSPLNVVPKASR